MKAKKIQYMDKEGEVQRVFFWIGNPRTDPRNIRVAAMLVPEGVICPGCQTNVKPMKIQLGKRCPDCKFQICHIDRIHRSVEELR